MQLVYCHCNSTETAMLSICSDILNAADHQQVTLLTVLALSAAFDTVDHDIILTRLGCCGGGICLTALFDNEDH